MKCSYLLIAIMALGTWSCQPARSDIFQEQVDPTLLSNLLNSAHTVIDFLPDSISRVKQPFLVAAKLAYADSGTRKYRIWFDAMNRPTGLVEFEMGRLKDSMLFHSNGQRMFSLFYNEEGEPTGPARYYYPDGRVRLDGRFENGIQTGIWREFSTEGRLITTHEYDKQGNKTR